MFQAAWIVDDIDEDDSDSHDEDDGMVLDESCGDFPRQEDANNFDISDDEASLNLRDIDEKTDIDSVMMVSFDVCMYSFHRFVFTVVDWPLLNKASI